MRKLLLGGIFAAALTLSAGAHATLISIGLQQSGFNGGAVSTVQTDGGAGGLAYFGSYGTFSFNTITAQGAPALAQGSLATTSVQTSSSTAGVITIYVTEQGLTAPVGATNFLSSFTSNLFSGAATSVVESTLLSNTNALYDGVTMSSQSFTNIGTGVATQMQTIAGVYSETVKYVVTVGSGSSNVNDTINLSASAVPEPASIVVLGAGLVGLGLVRRKRA